MQAVKFKIKDREKLYASTEGITSLLLKKITIKMWWSRKGV